MLKKILICIFLYSGIIPVFCTTISGNIRQDEQLNNKCAVIDSNTEKPVENARIYIPNYNFQTETDKNGHFELNANITDKAILQIEKEGYRPFSITIDKYITEKPLKLGIEKTNSTDVFIDKGVYHLGDDVYSLNSANCAQFKARPIGTFYSKKITLKKPDTNKQAVLVFGSVMGLDTKLAKELGQNAIVSVYSSPLEIIFNGQKIGELNMNGDNQQIVIPSSLIKNTNDLTIKTGENLFQYKYTDYDDMEFANLRIEYRDKVF
ncbi:MAG: carboxypeptidase-like regulatory domain-containing protein [Candidatus Gastranaerophilales bacterium]|nr:carboxypeptidase-like regulatory domain-containing protein [Candidatus Gastranaerophilales bacterium]